MTAGFTLEIMLIVLLAMTIVYCFVLDRKISKLTRLENDREALIEQLSAQIHEGNRLKSQLQELLNEKSRGDRVTQLRTSNTLDLSSRAKAFHDKRNAA